jgi:nucleoside 2-deoxyribosyltransferase
MESSLSIQHADQKVYIAGPFFNPAQTAIIQTIEDACNEFGYPFYSPRQHSGSADMTAAERKNPNCWDKVFASNEAGIYSCTIMIAVLEYALPQDQYICSLHRDEDFRCGFRHIMIELPDSGTVWEMGAYRALGGLVVGYHSTKQPDQLNLMLSHGTDALLLGPENLRKFFATSTDPHSLWIPKRARLSDGPIQFRSQASLNRRASEYNWSAQVGLESEIE